MKLSSAAPRFAVPTLEKLVDGGFRVKLVVTQPDRPADAACELAASPVKRAALELDLPITQPEKIKNNEEFRAQLERIAPEAIIVVGYGRIIPQWMIDLPPLRQHQPARLVAAEVSRSRAHPVGHRARRNRHRRDHHAHRCRPRHRRHPAAGGGAHRPEDTALTLAPRLAQTGAELMISTLAGLANGTITPQPQDNAQATLAPDPYQARTGSSISPAPPPRPGTACADFSPGRARSPSFAARCCMSMRPCPHRRSPWFKPATSRSSMAALLLGFAHGTALDVHELQIEGKKRMSASDFINGYRPRSDEPVGA